MADLFPWAKTDDLLAGFHVPGDGRVNPVDLTTALAKGARQLGVRVVEGVTVDGRADRRDGGGDRRPGLDRLDAPATATDDRVRVRRQLRRHVGPRARREERPGDPQPGGRALLPDHRHHRGHRPGRADLRGPVVVRLLPRGGRRDDGRPLRAAGRRRGRSRASRATSRSARSRPTGTGWRRSWRRRWPGSRSPSRSASARSSAARSRSRPTSRRPSARRPGIRNYFVAAGMNSVGVLSAGGLGRVLAHWITTGRPDVDVTGFNVDRFRAVAGRRRRTAPPRTTEILGTVYAAHTPGKQLRTARDTLLSPVHDRLVEQGGYLREVSGWEGADWFAGPGVDPGGRADLGPGAVVRAVGGRAPRRPRGRRPDGHELHGEVPRAGRRRRARCSTSSRPAPSTASPRRSPTPSGSTTTAGSRPT